MNVNYASKFGKRRKLRSMETPKYKNERRQGIIKKTKDEVKLKVEWSKEGRNKKGQKRKLVKSGQKTMNEEIIKKI